jgi:aminoglycoside/choline kinase family phosphotransferase
MNAPHRVTQRLHWAQSVLNDPHLSLHSASSDASFRSYWRTSSAGQSWIVMDAPPDKEDTHTWLVMAQRLSSAGLNAPLIKALDAEHGFVLMSDLGTRLFLSELRDDSVDVLYAQALDALLHMQTHVSSDDLPHYDEQRLSAEMALMPTWFLQQHLGCNPSCEQWDVIETTFRALLDNAEQQAQVFVHRDYHSRNLLIADNGQPGILDFQDAVHGPITYDLVSLLRDCYIAWPTERVDEWVEAYRRKAEAAGLATGTSSQFLRAFDLMGLQRHLKVLGIFCRLYYRDGKAGYLNDLPLVWHYTQTIGRKYPQTTPLITYLEQCIGTRALNLPSTACKP